MTRGTRTTPESPILRASLALFAAEHVLAFRMNTGAVKLEGRFMRFGTPGMADILSFPYGRVLWAECKSESGRQTELQRSFEVQVQQSGHYYLIVRSVDELRPFLASLRREASRAS